NTMDVFNTALNLNAISGESAIYRNRMITPNSGSANQLVLMQNVQGAVDAYIDIYQNIIYLQNHSSYLTAMNLNSMAYVNLLHNTIVAENNYFFDYGSALNITSSNNMLIQNNVISAPHRGYALTLNSNTDLVWMANAYYGAAPYLGKINGTDYPPLGLYSQQLTDPLASFANPLIDDNGYNTSSYLRNRGIASDLDTDIDGQLWTGMPSLGANDIADGGAMFTTNQSIGNGGDFPDLATAMDAVQSRGIDADVSFLMLNESVPVHYTMGYIPGTLGGYQFKLTAAEGANAALHHNATGTSDNYILMLKNLYNTTIEGLHFHTQNPSFGTAIALGSFNDQLLIRDNSFDTNDINPTSNNVSAIYGYSVQNRSLRIEDNNIQGLAYGVYLYGNINPTGYEIKGNTITNAHTGLYVNQLGAIDVWNNEISARDRALHLEGINTAYIRDNQMVTSGGNYVLYHNSSALTTGSQEIYNNYLRGLSAQDVIYLSRIQDAKIYHNTIINESSLATSRGLNNAAQTSGLDFRNNIVMANGGTAARFNSSNDIAALTANIYHSTSGVPVMLNTTPIADLAAYQSTFGDMRSMYTDPLLEDGSFVLQIGSPAINAGVTLPVVPFDIYGTLRELSDIGCYEYILLALDSPVNVRIIPVDGGLQLTWDPVPGANLYTIYFADTPDATNWDAISIPGTVMNLNPTVNARFFKIKAISN
ncbi:MAG: NosD domain-containing protein, partial [Candidatus Cloacimonetes bacterium]|nr:NosD domain-containing protein [Candidatus Cloacimonadota bacterium]